MRLLHLSVIGVCLGLSVNPGNTEPVTRIALGDEADANLLRALDHFVLFRRSGSDHIAGSGFVVTSDGHVVTAHHVIEKWPSTEQVAPTAYILQAAGEAEPNVYNLTLVPLELVGLNTQYDLAVFRIRNSTLADQIAERIGEFRVSEELASVERVLLLGPGKCENPWECIQNRTLDLDKASQGPYFSAEKPVDKGFSGGPAFDPDGNLVGVALRKNVSAGEFNTRILRIDAIDRILWAFGIDLVPVYRSYPDIVQEFHQILDELRYDLDWTGGFVDPSTSAQTGRKLEFRYTKRINSGLNPTRVRIRLRAYARARVDGNTVTYRLPEEFSRTFSIREGDLPKTSERTAAFEYPSADEMIRNHANSIARPGLRVDEVLYVAAEVTAIFGEGGCTPPEPCRERFDEAPKELQIDYPIR